MSINAEKYTDETLRKKAESADLDHKIGLNKIFYTSLLIAIPIIVLMFFIALLIWFVHIITGVKIFNGANIEAIQTGLSHIFGWVGGIISTWFYMSHKNNK